MYVHNPHCLPLSHLVLVDSSPFHTMTEPVSPRPLPAEHLVRSRASPRGVCGRQSGGGADFSPSKLVLPCQYHSANVPYSFIQVSWTLYNPQQLTEWLNNARSKNTPKYLTTHYLTRYSKPWLKDCLLPFPLAEVNGTVLQKAGMFKNNVHNTALAVIFGRDKKNAGQKTFRPPPYIMPGRTGSITSDGNQSIVMM